MGAMSSIDRKFSRPWWQTLRNHFLDRLRYSAPGWLSVLLFRPFYFYAIPNAQPEPVLVYTMGKVGTTSVEAALVRSGFPFVFNFHRMNDFRVPPVDDKELLKVYRRQVWLKRWSYPWILEKKPVKVITMVRDPIERLLSLYMYNYESFTGKRPDAAQIGNLLHDFYKVFEVEYAHSLVPGEFFADEIQKHLCIDVFKTSFPVEKGWQVIERDNISLMVMKLEISDEEKSAALQAWLGSDNSIKIGRVNTSADNGYSDLYKAFKQQARIPRQYAEHMYLSNFMSHFYSDSERQAFQRRWEKQFDDTLILPELLQAKLKKYHPKAR
jgi:hypothetical protein